MAEIKGGVKSLSFIAFDIRRTLFTLTMRNILAMLREMKEHCTRVKIHVRTNLMTIATNLGGGPKARESMKEPH